MADIEMPQLGETVTEGTITQWFKQVGDQVAEDEVLFEVSTDKVDSEVPVAGRRLRHRDPGSRGRDRRRRHPARHRVRPSRAGRRRRTTAPAAPAPSSEARRRAEAPAAEPEQLPRSRKPAGGHRPRRRAEPADGRRPSSRRPRPRPPTRSPAPARQRRQRAGARPAKASCSRLWCAAWSTRAAWIPPTSRAPATAGASPGPTSSAICSRAPAVSGDGCAPRRQARRAEPHAPAPPAAPARGAAGQPPVAPPAAAAPAKAATG